MTLTALLAFSVQHHASDLHLSSGFPPAIRVEGELIPIPDQAMMETVAIRHLMDSVLSAEQQALLAKRLELDFAFSLPNLANFRVNIFHQLNGIAAVFRIIPHHIPTIDQLKLPSILKKLVKCKDGLILVTGSTGSGKSTTLAAMVDHINATQSSHIITVEDPIEFIHENKQCLINQRQIHRDTLDFNTALRSALRQDPDVILIGEMRDLETIRLALTAAETGHLVLATLHTSSAPRSVSRMIDVFSDHEKNRVRNMLAQSLQAVLCQTLIKKTNGGRVAAFEIMLGSSAIRHLIREDKIPQMYTTMQTSTHLGMCTLEQYLQQLIEKKELDAALVDKFPEEIIC